MPAESPHLHLQDTRQPSIVSTFEHLFVQDDAFRKAELSLNLKDF